MSTTPKGLEQAMDTMDFMKRAWSSFSVPTQFAPTLDVEELDKRIKDLRTVEQWLALNQSLLRNTIQGLEIQRGTLGAINAMSESFSKAMQPPDEDTARTVARHAAEAAARQLSASAGQASAFGPQPRSEPSSGAPFDWSPSSMPSSGAFNTGSVPTPAGAAAAAEPSAMSAIDPMGWWELLQNNFQQIAQAATGSAAARTPAHQADTGSASRAAAAASAKPSNSTDESGQPLSRKDAQLKTGPSRTATSKGAPTKAAKPAVRPRPAKS